MKTLALMLLGCATMILGVSFLVGSIEVAGKCGWSMGLSYGFLSAYWIICNATSVADWINAREWDNP